MTQTERLIRDVSDTALLAAVYRARENDRPDAVFRDPFAQRLAGTRGEDIARGFPFSERHAWSWVTRTYLFDRFIAEQVEAGADMVINLAAGLDARPYRMTLPRALKWVEVDLPSIVDHKEEVLKADTPACALERVRLDLADEAGRRELLDRLGPAGSKTLIISEGLLIYLTPEQVGGLAEDLAAHAGIARWITDLASPGLMRMLTKQMGGPLGEGGATFKFAPAEGTDFFGQHGWSATDVQGMLKTAGRLGRLPLFLRLISMLPEPAGGRAGSRPWSGVCLLARQ